jgi:DNA-binding transcriptional LysR family regulator
MALGSVDLNLLVDLHLLLEEGNVTHAGVRAGTSQPAMSIALARLRRHYKDELLVRSASGYSLTPLARSLLPSVQESMRLIGYALDPGQGHEAATGRTFSISVSDYAIAVLSEPLLRRVRELAPGVRLELWPIVLSIQEADRGLLQHDLLIAPVGFRSGGQPEVIFRDRFVYVVDPGNPRLRDGRLSLADLAALPHAAAMLPHAELDPVGQVLDELGVAREVHVTTAGWLPLPYVVAGTDLVAAVPERLARRAAGAARVAVAEPPFGRVELVEAAWWHPMRAADPALAWLHNIVTDAAEAVLAGLGGGGREGRGPELRDVDPAHEMHAFLPQRMLDEIPECGRSARLPAPAGMDADRHQPRTVAVLRLLQHVVEAEPEALEEVPGRGVRRGDQVPDVVVHLAVGDHQERAAEYLRVVRKLVVTGIGVIPEASVLDQQLSGVHGGEGPHHPAAHPLPRGVLQRIDRFAYLFALLVPAHGHRGRAGPVITMGEHVMVPAPQPLTQRRVPFHGERARGERHGDLVTVDQAAEPPYPHPAPVLHVRFVPEIPDVRSVLERVLTPGVIDAVLVQRVLAAFLVVDHEVDRQPGATGPVEVGRFRTVAHEVAFGPAMNRAMSGAVGVIHGSVWHRLLR